MSGANHFLFRVFKRLDVFVGDRFDKRIKLFLRVDPFTSVISERTLKIRAPFVVLSCAFMPPIGSYRQPALFGVKIRYVFFDELV